MHRFVTPLLFLAMTILPARAADAEDAKLAAFFKSYLDEEFKARPLEATRAGDHRYDDRLDDVSPKARAAGKERTRKALDELPRRVEKSKLTRNGQIDYEILEHSLKYALWQADNERRFE